MIWTFREGDFVFDSVSRNDGDERDNTDMLLDVRLRNELLLWELRDSLP